MSRNIELSEEDIKKYIKAGSIAKNVREEVYRVVKPGTRLYDIAEYVENRIRELGGEPAFPTNISINDIAAHYTPSIDDRQVIPDNSVVKIDLGVHVDGYIADTAVTISFNPAYEPLLEASEKALEKALDIIRPGIKLSEIGRVIEDTITSYGYKPIRNLMGHSIDRYLIHSGVSIPNYYEKSVETKLVDGVYAIEPFATNGVGLVGEGSVVTIFSLIGYRPRARLTSVEKKIVNWVWSTRKTLPFCERWLRHLAASVDGLRNAIGALIRRGLLHVYPILVEKKHGIVSQFEHTVVIYGREVIVTTM